MGKFCQCLIVICPPHDSGGVLSFQVFILPGLCWSVNEDHLLWPVVLALHFVGVGAFVYCGYISSFLAHLSQRLKVSFFDHSMNVFCHASVNNLLKRHLLPNQ